MQIKFELTTLRIKIQKDKYEKLKSFLEQQRILPRVWIEHCIDTYLVNPTQPSTPTGTIPNSIKKPKPEPEPEPEPKVALVYAPDGEENADEIESMIWEPENLLYDDYDFAVGKVLEFEGRKGLCIEIIDDENLCKICWFDGGSTVMDYATPGLSLFAQEYKFKYVSPEKSPNYEEDAKKYPYWFLKVRSFEGLPLMVPEDLPSKLMTYYFTPEDYPYEEEDQVEWYSKTKEIKIGNVLSVDKDKKKLKIISYPDMKQIIIDTKNAHPTFDALSEKGV